MTQPMTPADISITTTRLLADIQALAKNVHDALTKTTDFERQNAWRASVDTLGGIITGVSQLAHGSSTWGTLLGGVTTVDALSVSLDKALDAYTKTGDINSVEVSDVLGVMGGVSDLAGGLLANPGPWFTVGLSLKGVGLGAAMGQNAVGTMTIGDLIGASPVNAATDLENPALEIVITARKLSVEIETGGTVWSVYQSQKNAPNGFADWEAFKDAVAVCNPDIADLNKIAVGTKLMLPEKLANGSTVYNYSNGTRIQNNPANGEYHMVVPDADGGQTVYSRVYMGDVDGPDGQLVAQYDVRQVSTDVAGAERYSYKGTQMGLDGDITPDYSRWNNDTQSGTSIYGDGGVRTDVVTDKATGQTTLSAVDQNTGEQLSTAGGSMGLTPAAYQQLIYSDMAGFLSALRNGDKLNQALYGVKLTLDVMLSQGKTLDQSMAGLRNGLDAVAGAVGVVAALHALQSDDTLTQLNGAVGLLSSSNQLFAAMNGGAIGEGLTTNGFLDPCTHKHKRAHKYNLNHSACRASHSKQTQGAQHA